MVFDVIVGVVVYAILSIVIGYYFPIIIGKFNYDVEHALSILIAPIFPLFLIIRGYFYPIMWDTNANQTSVLATYIMMLFVLPIPLYLLSTPSKFPVFQGL